MATIVERITIKETPLHDDILREVVIDILWDNMDLTCRDVEHHCGPQATVTSGGSRNGSANFIYDFNNHYGEVDIIACPINDYVSGVSQHRFIGVLKGGQ